MNLFYDQPEIISGGLLGGVVSYLLDTYTATVAYSPRKLRTAQTTSLRLRRDSDNAESDFGFSGGNLDTAAITTWLAGATGYVTTWYDQSGNGDDATITTAGSQPTYVAAGINSRPAISGDTTKIMNMPNTGTTTQCNCNILKINSLVNAERILLLSNGSTARCQLTEVGTTLIEFVVYNGTYNRLRYTPAALPETMQLSWGWNYTDHTTLFAYRNGTQIVGAGDSTALFSSLKQIDFGSSLLHGEFISFPAYDFAGRAAVESNQMAYWGVS